MLHKKAVCAGHGYRPTMLNTETAKARKRARATPTTMSLRLARVFPAFAYARVAMDEQTGMGSLLDVLSVVLGSKGTARATWKKLAGVVEGYMSLKLPGRSKPTPMASFKTILEVITILPGKRAHEFRKPCSLYLARWLATPPAAKDPPPRAVDCEETCQGEGLWRPWGLEGQTDELWRPWSDQANVQIECFSKEKTWRPWVH